MAGVFLRSGSRRLLASSAKGVIDAGAATPAICKHQARAPTTVRSSPLPLAPKVDSGSTDALALLPSAAGGSGASIPARSTSHHPKVDAGIANSLALLAGGSVDPSSACSRSRSSTYHHPQVDAGRSNTFPLLASTAGSSGAIIFASQQLQMGLADSISDGSPAVSSRSSPSYMSQVQIGSPVTVGVLDSVSGVSSRSYLSQPYAGAARRYSSLSYRSGPSQASKIQVRHFCEKPKAEICDVLKGLQKIETQVGDVDKKVDQLGEKLDTNIEKSAEVKKEVETMKTKEKGSGDWTSFKIGGKTINWLSVASAVWALFK